MFFVVLKPYDKGSWERLHVHVFKSSAALVLSLSLCVSLGISACVRLYHDVLMCHINKD